MKNIIALVKYNLKIIFGNKFIYFLGASFLFYLITTGISLFSSSVTEVKDIYYQLIFPGILLVFFPSTYSIQSDADARILEILFGIPNYRYKVSMLRLLIIFLIIYVLMNILALFNNFILVEVPVIEMGYQLMFVLIFFGVLSFTLSTVIRNGNGTAVIMVICGLIFWFLSSYLGNSQWNVFLNPFSSPSDMNEELWYNTIVNNRIFIVVVSISLILWSLYNLQKREKFIR